MAVTSERCRRALALIAGASLLLPGFALLAIAAGVGLYNAADTVNDTLFAAFRAKHPAITVKFGSGSTGPIAERAIAEKAKPQADVVDLVNNIALERLKQAGVFEPYEPKGSKIDAPFRESDGFYMRYFATAMCMVVKCPELNSQENIWQFLRDNWLSNRIFLNEDDLVDHCCDTWNKLEAQPWRVMSSGMREWAHRL